MIVVMKPDATAAQIEHMANHIASLGLTPQVIHGTHQTVIAALGEERPGLTEVLEPGEGVEKVLPIMAPYKRASSELKRERTVVKARGLEVGGTRVAVIAGPCSVESEEQIVTLARQLKALGATGLRGGAYKPRTSPYSFQGHKELGLKMLATAGDETGLAIVTEVMAPEHVPIVAEYADVLQIGARNMQNYQLLQAVGDSGKPALLKRGMSATLDEFLLAAEYILDRNNPQRHALRARHPHLRGPHPVHAAAGDGSLPARQEPPAGRRRPVARHRQGAAGRADGQGGHRRGGRRADHRGARRPRARRQRRSPDDHAGGVQAIDRPVPADRGGRRSDGLDRRSSAVSCRR